jgi:regulatory protein
VASGKLPLHERALRLLAVRPRTRRELQTRLVRAGFDPQEVASELDRLEEVGLVDDARFAAEFAEHALDRRLEGRRAVAAGLAARGVDRRLIEEAMQTASGDDGHRLARLAQARAGRLATLPPEAAYRRLVSFLVRRGHEPSAARAAAARALRLAADASEST